MAEADATRVNMAPVVSDCGDRLHGMLHRTGRWLVRTLSFRRQKQMGAPAVGRIQPPLDERLTLETHEDARERARVKAQEVRQLAGRDTGKSSDQAQPETLR